MNDTMSVGQKLILLDTLIDRALDELYNRDIYLLAHGVHERAIVFRFGHYLQNLMDNVKELCFYNLDFEYNRNGLFAKRIPCRPRNGAYPDLIIHRRGTNDHNLLMMEFKSYWNQNTQEDSKKIQQFLDPMGKYKYYSGRTIILGKCRCNVIIKPVETPVRDRATDIDSFNI